MLKLLKITVSGYRMLKDEFVFDFTNKSNVRTGQPNKEIIEIDSKLYTFNTFALTGSNASGKTTTLAIINQVLFLMKTGRWPYKKRDFKNDRIKLKVNFYLNGIIYLYQSLILRGEDNDSIEIVNPYSKITKEFLSYSKYLAQTGRNYESKLNFVEEIKYKSNIEDTSMLVLLCKDEFTADYISPFANTMGYSLNKSFFESLKYFDENITLSVIQLLDESIEYLKIDSKELIKLKRFGSDEMILSKNDLLSILSNGTIKGIELYLRIIKTIKAGGIILIDEIENCFHKNLVSNILFLLQDESINTKCAQIIFSTHYVEILDILDRQDDIYILHKINNEINITNLALDYPIRGELLKSKRFNDNTFNTLLNYNKLMEVNRSIKKEISGNDWRLFRVRYAWGINR